MNVVGLNARGDHLTYKFKNYITITPEIKEEVSIGIKIAGSKGCLAREMALNNGLNITRILDGQIKSIHLEKYVKLKEMISNELQPNNTRGPNESHTTTPLSCD